MREPAAKADQSVLRKSQRLTKVEGLRSITEEHSSDCQQTAGGDAESVELPESKSTKSEQENYSLKDSPANIKQFQIMLQLTIHHVHHFEVAPK